MSDVKIIAGPKTWIEGDAVQQLKKTAELPGMVRAVGMPDLQSVERITDASAFAALGLDEKRLCLLVHSGSRGYGEAVLRAHTARFGGNGVDDTSEAAEDYLKEQQYGLRWAEANRALIARR